MLKKNNKIVRRSLQIFDVALTALSLVLAYHLRTHWSVLGPVRPFSEYLVLLLFIIPIWAVLLSHYRAYESIRTKNIIQIIWPVIKSVIIGMVVLMTLLFFIKYMFLSRLFIGMFFTINLLLLTSSKVAVFLVSHYVRKKGYNYRNVLIIGAGPRAADFADVLDRHKEWGIKVLGFMETGSDEDEDGKRVFLGKKILGHIDSLKTALTTLQVDEVVFVVPRKALDRISDAVLACEQVGIKVSVVADFYPHTIAKMELGEIEGWPLMVFNPTMKLEESFMLKRALDVIVSSIMLALVAPVFIFLTIGIKLTSPGPVFFRQERCGLFGRRFNILKFRTMIDNADALKERLNHLNEMSGPVFKAKNDPRITPLGKFMRKYSLDELPQFINVLKGDMSIVGPRPPLPSEVELYDYAQRRRLSVLPGITCLWQVSGRNKLGFVDWVRLDLEYIDRWSLWLDIKIIAKTLPAVLRGTGM